MREIKFRGKQQYTGEWVYGHIFCIEGTWRIQPQGYKEAWQEIDYETTCQYTNLKDKNNKEDYVCDLVKVKIGGIYYVREIYQAENGAYRINLPTVSNIGDLGVDLFSIEHENVGNIYENKELSND